MLKLAFIMALTIAVYWPAMHADFIYDDLHFVVTNDFVRHGGIGLKTARALTLESYKLNFLASEDPFYFHLVNLAIHLANGLLVFVLAASLLTSEGAALFAAGLFLLHPLQSEAVIYITGRAELLAAFFIFASLWFFGKRHYLPAVLAMALGIGSKEIALVTPALWALLALKESKLSLKLAACLTGGLIITAFTPLQNYLTFIRNNANLAAFYSVLSLLARAVVPVGLTIDHDFLGIATWVTIAAAVLYCAVMIAGFRYRSTVAGFSILWIGVLTLPHILIEPPGYLAEHHFYAPMFGISLLMASAFQAAQSHDFNFKLERTNDNASSV